MAKLDKEDYLDMAKGTYSAKEEKAEKKPKLGGGGRFKALAQKFASQGKSDPKGLAAYVGRKKFGKSRFQELAAAGRGN